MQLKVPQATFKHFKNPVHSFKTGSGRLSPNRPRCCELAALTSEFVQLSVDRVHNEHVWSLVALSDRGSDQGQRPAGLLALPLLVDKVVQLAQIGVQEKVPAEEDTHTED